MVYFLPTKFFNLATALREIIYLLKKAPRLFFEKSRSVILSLQCTNLPKNELSNEFSRGLT